MQNMGWSLTSTHLQVHRSSTGVLLPFSAWAEKGKPSAVRMDVDFKTSA
jgi:hypothetical protein